MLPSEVADQLRAALLAVAKSGFDLEDVAKKLDRFGWELDFLRQIGGEVDPVRSIQPPVVEQVD